MNTDRYIAGMIIGAGAFVFSSNPVVIVSGVVLILGCMIIATKDKKR